ncbi:MAG: tRNA epoxyqueuosine(34) reductase QueG [Planctomycetota bacterium]
MSPNTKIAAKGVLFSINPQSKIKNPQFPFVLASVQQNTTARRLAAEHGFAISGIALIPADGWTPRAASLAKWLDKGLYGPLDYMRKTQAARTQIRVRFPWANSILALGAFYAPTVAPCENMSDLRMRVARYARGRDYHRIFERRLKKLARALQVAGVCARARWIVDTGPVLERAWAEAAGLGWRGKNTCLIHPRGGSFLLLAEIIMDSTPEPNSPEPNHCGNCRRCLDACPTRALIEPGVLDARRCLATWNIECGGRTPEELWAAQGSSVFGCDICQEVCPYNAPRKLATPDEELLAPRSWWNLSLTECIAMTTAQFNHAFTASPLRRSGLKGLRLSAITAAGNSKTISYKIALQACLTDPDADIRARAVWAITKLPDK